ncbi:PIG-L deacetylase family protein [Streptacidiphilus monticola]
MSPAPTRRTTVLVVAAHPDDELLGAGGTLARHALAGDQVHALVLADGATSRYADGMDEVLAKCAHRAAEVLGLASLRMLSLPDQRLDVLPLVQVTAQVEAVVAELKPRVVYTHFPGDANADHAVVARAAWTACRPYVLPGLRRFAVFETPPPPSGAGRCRAAASAASPPPSTPTWPARWSASSTPWPATARSCGTIRTPLAARPARAGRLLGQPRGPGRGRTLQLLREVAP